MSGLSLSTSGLIPLNLALMRSTIASLRRSDAKWLFLIQRQSLTVSVIANVLSGLTQFSQGRLIEWS